MKLRPQSRHVKVLSLKLTANLLCFVFGSQRFRRSDPSVFDPTFPGAIIASAKAVLAMAIRLAASIGRYPAAVARNLFLVEDELMFAQRVRAAAGRLRVPVQALGPTDARNRVWN